LTNDSLQSADKDQEERTKLTMWRENACTMQL